MSGLPMRSPASTPTAVPATQQGYEGRVAPIMKAGSKRPPPRLAAAQEKSIIVCPISDRRSTPPSSDGARATPIGTYRAFSRIPAAIAAAASPPAARTAVAANCADPANSAADMTIGAMGPMTGSASTPKEIESSTAATAYGTPRRTPSRKAGSEVSRLIGRVAPGPRGVKRPGGVS